MRQPHPEGPRPNPPEDVTPHATGKIRVWVAQLGHLAHGPIVQNVVGLLSATTVERILLAVILMVVARQVGPTEFGRYAAAFALVRILAVFFSLGLDNWILRHGFRTGDHMALATQAATCLLIKAGLGLLWLAALVGLTQLLDRTAFPAHLLLLAGLAVWFEEIAAGVWSAYKAALRNRAILGWIVAAQAGALAVVGGLALGGVDTVLPYLVGQTVVAGIVAIGALILFGVQWGVRIDLAQIRPTLRSAVPYAWSVGLALIYGRADIAIIAYMLGEFAAGLYAPAVSLASALGLAPMALYTVMLPVMSRIYVEAPRRVAAVGGRMLAASLGLGVLFAAALFVAAPWVVRLIFGDAFALTATILMILSGVLAARFMGLASAALLMAVGLQTPRVWVQAAVALLNVALTIWVVSAWGPFGSITFTTSLASMTLGQVTSKIVGVAWVFVATEWILVLCYMALFWWWAVQVDETNAARV